MEFCVECLDISTCDLLCTLCKVTNVYCNGDFSVFYILIKGPPWWLSGKDSTNSAGATGDLASIPGSGRFPGEGNGNPLQYSCLGNPMDRGVWWAAIHGITKSLKGLSTGHISSASFPSSWLTWLTMVVVWESQAVKSSSSWPPAPWPGGKGLFGCPAPLLLFSMHLWFLSEFPYLVGSWEPQVLEHIQDSPDSHLESLKSRETVKVFSNLKSCSNYHPPFIYLLNVGFTLKVFFFFLH